VNLSGKEDVLEGGEPSTDMHKEMTLTRLQTIALFLLRIIAGFDYSLHGFQKAFGLFGGFGPHGGKASGLFLAAGYIEVIAGSLIIVGLLTRPVALIASGEMATAYFKVHAPMGFFPIVNHGELPVLFCFLFLFFAAVGGGDWSLDALLFRRTTKLTR
jgi:putative oxidoreductase